jgi:hypothetical protein
MSDEVPFYSPNAKPRPPRQPKPGEHLWTLRRSDCELRFNGEFYGWECQCLLDGILAYGRRCPLREQALKEAERQRQRLMKIGWAAEHYPRDEGF